MYTITLCECSVCDSTRRRRALYHNDTLMMRSLIRVCKHSVLYIIIRGGRMLRAYDNGCKYVLVGYNNILCYLPYYCVRAVGTHS